MIYVLLIGFIAACGFVVYEGFLGDAASAWFVGGYVLASLIALVMSKLAPAKAGLVKWAWVALSLVVIYAIISGPMAFFQLS